MQRTAIKKLIEWKNSPRRKPLILLGARQVGKTWLMKEFGRTYFQNVAYIRFDNNQPMQAVFKKDFDLASILSAIQLYCGFQPSASSTLIIFDEIQSCPEALTSLKYFCEEAREYHIIAAGSLLGVGSQNGTGFPVGKVDRLYLYPMSFSEFLLANDKEQMLDIILKRDWSLLSTFAEKLTEQLRYYYYVGGMPEVVQSFVANHDFQEARSIQKALLSDFRDDFGKHATWAIKPRIEKVWDAIPAQLSRDNKKFIYSNIDNGSKRELEPALRWLMDAGLVTQNTMVSKPAAPLDAYKEDAMKVFFLDIGLLAAKTNLSSRVLLEGNRVFQEFKGALTEQYVHQQLLAEFDLHSFYWTAGQNHAEVDFLLESSAAIIPVEVKAERNLQAKSLKSYCEKFRPPLAIRSSMHHYYRQTLPYSAAPSQHLPTEYTLIDLPLYAIATLQNEINSILP